MLVFLRGAGRVSPRRASYFLCSAKESIQRKAASAQRPLRGFPGCGCPSGERAKLAFGSDNARFFSARPAATRRFAKGMAHQCGGKTSITKLLANLKNRKTKKRATTDIFSEYSMRRSDMPRWPSR